MPEYVLIYDNKQSSEYGRILNMSNTIHSARALYEYLLRDERIKNPGEDLR